MQDVCVLEVCVLDVCAGSVCTSASCWALPGCSLLSIQSDDHMEAPEAAGLKQTLLAGSGLSQQHWQPQPVEDEPSAASQQADCVCQPLLCCPAMVPVTCGAVQGLPCTYIAPGVHCGVPRVCTVPCFAWQSPCCETGMQQLCGQHR